MFLKNAAKLHFLFHSTKYLSRNSRNYSFFFHFVNSACHFTSSFCCKVTKFLAYKPYFNLDTLSLFVFFTFPSVCFSFFFIIFAHVMTQKQHYILISLASNEQAKERLAAAREQLTQLLTEVKFTSEIWTEPFSTNCSAPYLNQLCEGTTAFGLNLLNELLKETEKRLGRTHNEDGIVAIDLDLLQYDHQQLHLRDWQRDYVKNLLNEL